MDTRVVHCKRASFDVYIGRPEVWGNPYVLGRDGDRKQVIQKFEWYLLGSPTLLQKIRELRGKVLGCWCHPKSCHGDILAAYADLPDSVLQVLIEHSRRL